MNPGRTTCGETEPLFRGHQAVRPAALCFGAIANGNNGAGTFTTAVESGNIVLTSTSGVTPTPVTSFSIATGPGSDLTLSYSGGSGSQIVLLQTNNVAGPLSDWT